MTYSHAAILGYSIFVKLDARATVNNTAEIIADGDETLTAATDLYTHGENIALFASCHYYTKLYVAVYIHGTRGMSSNSGLSDN
jgi:hypothetical protein